MEEIIDKINSVLRYQMNFKWQEIYNYCGYKNSFEYHVKHHPIDEKDTGKWDYLIDYANKKTISDSYYNISTNLASKFALLTKDEYDIQYIKRHASVNIVNKNNGLIVCLKYRRNKIHFDIATCFFPSKINALFSVKDRIFSTRSIVDKETDLNNLKFIPYFDNNTQNKNNIKDFEEAMREFFGGSNSTEYKILFKNETKNIDGIINSIINDTTEYLNLMENLIKDEDDKEYYFVFNDGIEYVAKLSLLYKIKDKNYENLYQKFLNIDINNVYKAALDKCKKYIDEGENNYGNHNKY